ncbi:MAG: flagellar biosynthesis protein [Novosphingobium sp.]|nr:MAG: flagellar biosynthesis protein [Novosphingobium sp.]
MSDGQFTAGLSFGTVSSGSGFRSDARFVSLGGGASYAAPEPQPEQHFEPEDPVTVAFAEGYAAGAAEAQALAAQQAAIDAEAAEGLALSFARLDGELAEALRQKLRTTVAALCEAALAPLTIDEDALIHRIERAVALFSRADDERVVRLHPEDIALISQRFAEEWHVVPDGALERGAIRVETATGGVEDSPELWRRAIEEALSQC